MCVYIGCDNHPIERQVLAEAVGKADRYRHMAADPPCMFVGSDGPVGKRCDASQTRDALAWQPRFQSFLDWLAMTE